MKTIVDQLAEQTARAEAAEARATKAEADLSAALTLAAEQETKLNAEIVTLKESVSVLTTRAESAEALCTAETARANAAEKKLTLDPDHIAIHGRPAPLADGTTEGAGTVKTKDELLAEYSKLTDPKTKAEFRRDHPEILK